MGLVYEQVEADVYVEPNTSRRSTHTRAIDDLFAVYRYTHGLEMHQHEGVQAALLPADFEGLPAADQERIRLWAERLFAAWRAVGADHEPQPRVLYRGQPRQQLFLDHWRGRCPGMLGLNTEVRNNRLEPGGVEPTPLAYQFRAALAALEATVTMGLR